MASKIKAVKALHAEMNALAKKWGDQFPGYCFVLIADGAPKLHATATAVAPAQVLAALQRTSHAYLCELSVERPPARRANPNR